MPHKLMRLKTQGQGATMLRLITIFMFIASMSSAETWQKLSNEGIEAALSGKTLKYGYPIQKFFADGRTTYETQIVTHGEWRAENNKYCSVWPPAVTWVCYDVEANSEGTKVRFIAKNGTIDIGDYTD